MTLNEEISAIVGVRIAPGQWKEVIDKLDRQGAFGRKQTNAILVMLCEHIEKLETYGADKPQTPIQP